MTSIVASDGTGCTKSVEDVYPGLTDQEILASIDQDYLISYSFKLDKFATASGKWRLRRNKWNDRGDESSQLQKKRSIEQIGLVLDGCDAVLVQAEDPTDDDTFDVSCWATRLVEGLQSAADDDANAANKNVLTALSVGLPAVKLYRRGIHKRPEFLIWLKEWGNKTNHVVTGTTPMEAWRSTAVVDKAFARRADVNKWTIASVGSAKAYNLKHFGVADVLYSQRWGSWTAFERCQHFFK